MDARHGASLLALRPREVHSREDFTLFPQSLFAYNNPTHHDTNKQQRRTTTRPAAWPLTVSPSVTPHGGCACSHLIASHARAITRIRAATALSRAFPHALQTLACIISFKYVQTPHSQVGFGGTRRAEQVLHKLASISALSAVHSAHAQNRGPSHIPQTLAIIFSFS